MEIDDKSVTNSLPLFNKGMKIEDGCILLPLITATKIIFFTYSTVFKQLILLQTCQKKHF